MDLRDLCPFCERAHRPEACPRAAAAVAWRLGDGVAARAAAGDAEALADLLVFRFHAAVRDALARAREEVGLLQGLSRDLDQERRFVLARHLVSAAKALEGDRLGEAAEEVGAASRRGRGDPRVSLLEGYLKLRAGECAAASEALESAAVRTEPGPHRAALRLLLGRVRLVEGDAARAEERFRQALDEAVPPLRAEILFQIARLRAAGGAGRGDPGDLPRPETSP